MKVTNYATSKSGVKNSVIAVACEKCNHIMVVKTGRSLTAFKSLAAIAKEQIGACPACGTPVSVKEKLSVYGALSEHRQAGEELALILPGIQEEDLQKELVNLIDKVKKPEDLPADNGTAQEIRGDIVKLKQYLDTVIKLETDSRLLITRIVTLNRQKNEELRKAADAQLDAMAKFHREDKAVAGKVEKLQAEILKLETEFETKDWEKAVKVRKTPAPKAPEYLDVTPPAQPRYPVLKKPDRNGVYPNEPVCPPLKTPGLFNKKKIQEENAQVIARHQAAVAAYRQACERENVQLVARYEGMMALYRQECILLEEKKRKNEELEREYAQKLQKHKASAAQRQEKALAEAMQQKEEARVQLEQKISAIRQEIEGMSNDVNTPRIQLQVGAFFDVQIEEAKRLLKELTTEKNRIYSVNVIYPTYRELVAESSFYEYFSSGRCDTLEGTHGAYNLFEAECRSDVVARMIRTLEEIKQSQVILHRQLSQIAGLLRDIDDSLEKAMVQIRKISEERMPTYLEENRSKGKAAAEKEKPDAKETAVGKYFRLAAACAARVETNIAEAKKITL